MRARRSVLWAIAVVVTVLGAAWQRWSGPTRPARAAIRLGGVESRFRLPRSGETGSVLAVDLPGTAARATGELAWRRFPSDDRWTVVELAADPDGSLRAAIPSQPPAGKVEYQVRLRDRDGSKVVVPSRPAVARFKGAVPAWLLAPHVAVMLMAILWASRAGAGAALEEGRRPDLTWTSLVLLVTGGLILGPLVQKVAFGALWTGWPLGSDLTDNKTAVAALAWGWAVWQQRAGREARWSVVMAAAITLLVFSIPHSTWGSELDWGETASRP